MNPIIFLSLGPGDPDLLTVKAVKTLKAADVIMVPATGSRSRAADIIREWCDKSRLTVYELPMLKDRQAVSAVYDRIYADCVSLYHKGRRVVVAVEGDVSIYASIHYVMDRLQAAGIPTEQSPGIPSFIAAAAEAGLSLVSQQQRLIVLPGNVGHTEDQASTDNISVQMLRQLLESHHVVVIMKLSQCQDAVKEFLRQNEAAVCHYFENIGTPEAFHTSDHQEIISLCMPYFSLCVLSNGISTEM